MEVMILSKNAKSVDFIQKSSKYIYKQTKPFYTTPLHQQQLEKGLRLFSARCRLEAKLAQYGLHCDTNPIFKGWGIRQAQSPLGSYHNEPWQLEKSLKPFGVYSLWYEPNLSTYQGDSPSIRLVS